MRIVAGTLLACVFSGCTAVPEKPRVVRFEVSDTGRELFPLETFRPEVEALEDQAAVDRALEGARRALRRAARAGLGSSMRLEQADGSVIRGVNHYRLDGGVARMREVRPGYTAVIVGETLCYIDPMAEPDCRPAAYDFGLPQFTWGAVVRAVRETVQCDQGRCIALEVKEFEVLTFESGLVLVDPGAHRLVRLVLEADTRRPISVTSAHFRDGEQEATATEVFDYRADVPPIELPAGTGEGIGAR